VSFESIALRSLAAQNRCAPIPDRWATGAIGRQETSIKHSSNLCIVVVELPAECAAVP
jgi:hypothetical protein